MVTVSYASTDIIDEKELVFFERRCPRGFLKILENKKKKLEYIGPNAISIYERLKKPISSYEFFMIIEQVAYSTLLLQKNELMWNKVVWDVKNVFINQNTKEIQLIFLPFSKFSYTSATVMDFLNTVSSLAFPEESNADFVSKFSFFIRGMKWYDPNALEKYVMGENRESVIVVNNKNLGDSGYMTDKPIDFYSHYDAKAGVENETMALVDDEATGLLTEEDDLATALLVEDTFEEGTMLLSETNMGVPNIQPQPVNNVLRRISNNEQIALNKAVFRLGKNAGSVDYCVANNAVSRNHADFISRGNNVFVVDLNSKNGTYVNGSIVPIQVEVPLTYGDVIKLANEDFILEKL